MCRSDPGLLLSQMSVDADMYYSCKDTLRKVGRKAPDISIPKGIKQRRLHKAFLHYHAPKNWPLLRDALKKMGRSDLIGNGKQHLVPTFQPKGTADANNDKTGKIRRFKTKYTDMGGTRKSGSSRLRMNKTKGR
ncbi:MAG: DUF3362 domain-containing protein [Gammaproteobacteria bacterium]